MSAPREIPSSLDIVDALPIDASRVLYCGRSKSISAAYKAKSPAAIWENIAFEGLLSASFGEKYSDRVVGDYDLIIFDEFTDGVPLGSILEAAQRRLKKLGNLVLKLENAAHWLRLSEVLQGSVGINRNRSAIREGQFFVLDQVANKVKNSGFSIVKVRPVVSIPDAETRKNALNLLNAAPIENLADCAGSVHPTNIISYIITCIKTPSDCRTDEFRTQRVHICAMSPRFLDVRARLPAIALDTLPELVVTAVEKSLALPNYDIKSSKICVLQRLSISNDASYLRWLRDRARDGWIIVAESDDHPALLAAVHGRNPEKESWLTITGVHAVQTSTPALAEAYRARNSEVATFPNCVFSLPPFVDRSGPLRIFLGALNRERITRQVARSLDKFCKVHPEAEFVVVHDRAFFDALPTVSKTFHPAAGYDAYLNMMASCHIALMPLEGTFGETFKSDVKFLEAASRSVAAIASPTIYADTIIDGETGLIARSIEDWGRLLEALAGEMTVCQRLAWNAWGYVKRERMFAAQAAARRDWYKSLWDRRAELNAALAERHPEIRAGQTA